MKNHKIFYLINRKPLSKLLLTYRHYCANSFDTYCDIARHSAKVAGSEVLHGAVLQGGGEPRLHDRGGLERVPLRPRLHRGGRGAHGALLQGGEADQHPEILALRGDVKVGAAYPDAKYLLTDRDPQAWYRSMRTAILRPRSYLERPPISWIFSLFRSAAPLLLPAVLFPCPASSRTSS